jgi:hypothetical protein
MMDVDAVREPRMRGKRTRRGVARPTVKVVKTEDRSRTWRLRGRFVRVEAPAGGILVRQERWLWGRRALDARFAA